jgi:hypothetical protein
MGTPQMLFATYRDGVFRYLSRIVGPAPDERRRGGAVVTGPDVRELRAALDELANALQGAVGLAVLIRRDAQTVADDAVKLEAAVGRAASALRRVQPRGGASQEGR